VASATRKGAPGSRPPRSRRSAGPALRAELEARIQPLREAADQLAPGPRATLSRDVRELLRQIDALHAEWHAAAPHLLTGQRPAAAASRARHLEVARALRRLAGLRARVLAADRALGVRPPDR